jgi:hypothetical protein
VTYNLVTICTTCHDMIHKPGNGLKLTILAKVGDPQEEPNADIGLRFLTE